VLPDQFVYQLLHGGRVLVVAQDVVPGGVEDVAAIAMPPRVRDVDLIPAPVALGERLREPGDSLGKEPAMKAQISRVRPGSRAAELVALVAARRPVIVPKPIKLHHGLTKPTGGSTRTYPSRSLPVSPSSA
jgi:hypothetical protein